MSVLHQLRNVIGQEININNTFEATLDGIQLHDPSDHLFTLLFYKSKRHMKIPSQYIITFHDDVLHLNIDPKIFIDVAENEETVGDPH